MPILFLLQLGRIFTVHEKQERTNSNSDQKSHETFSASKIAQWQARITLAMSV
jgi:hypothetical protein